MEETMGKLKTVKEYYEQIKGEYKSTKPKGMPERKPYKFGVKTVKPTKMGK
jgi:hypothetical protein